jgi:hypothetical protein
VGKAHTIEPGRRCPGKPENRDATSRPIPVTGSGERCSAASHKWEGTQRPAQPALGVNRNYQTCGRDCYLGAQGGQWQALPIAGKLVADAFMGSMGSLQAFVDGVAQALPTRLENAIGRIRVVEAAYISSERDGISMQLPQLSGWKNARLGTRFVKTELATASAMLVETPGVAHCRADFP